jgi:hypothetical protein
MASGNVNVVFPRGGTDRRAAFQQEAPYTTRDSVNVRPLADGVERGGTRPGLTRAFPGLVTHGGEPPPPPPPPPPDPEPDITPPPVRFAPSVAPPIGSGPTVFQTPSYYIVGNPASGPGFIPIGAEGDPVGPTVFVPFREISGAGPLQTLFEDQFGYADGYLDDVSPQWSAIPPNGVYVRGREIALVPPDPDKVRDYHNAFGPAFGEDNNTKYTVRLTIQRNRIFDPGSWAQYNLYLLSQLHNPLRNGVFGSVQIYGDGGVFLQGITFIDGAPRSTENGETQYIPGEQAVLTGKSNDVATLTYGDLTIEWGCPKTGYTRHGFGLSASENDNIVDADDYQFQFTREVNERNRSRLFFGGPSSYFIEQEEDERGFATIEGEWPGLTDNVAPTSGVDYSRKVYVVNGGEKVGVFDPEGGTLESLEPTTEIGIPTKCRSVTIFHDRLALAVDPDNPQEAYFSRVGDPGDFDTSRTDSRSATSLTASGAGRIGQPIIDQIPFLDDYLIYACSGSMWNLTGDPNYGGQLLNISDGIGLIAQHGWCRTPEGTIVFLSRSGLFVISDTSRFAEPFSERVMPLEFKRLVASDWNIRLVYDHDHFGVHIFAHRHDLAAKSHWWVDWQTKGFNEVEFPDLLMNPAGAVWYDSDLTTKRGVVLGCLDGYLRSFRSRTGHDDNLPFDSRVVIGPIRMGAGDGSTRLDHMVAVLGLDSGDVSWELRVGKSEEEAFARPAVTKSGTWRAGRNLTNRPWVRGNSFYLVIRGSGSHWSMERIEMRLQDSGIVVRSK